MEPAYTRITGAGYEMLGDPYLCGACGVPVFDTETHTMWHKAVGVVVIRVRSDGEELRTSGGGNAAIKERAEDPQGHA